MTLARTDKDGLLLKVRGIELRYDTFCVLRDLDFELRRGEIHAIVGEHGAGKSSMGLMLNGIRPPASGTIEFDGTVYSSLSIQTARRIGILMVYQHTCLYDSFSVAENIFLSDRTSRAFMWRYRRRAEESTKQLLDKYDFNISPTALIRNLNQSDQTIVEILKHISQKPKLLILDEALERLSAPAQRKVTRMLMELKTEGSSILYITHRIDDLYQVADRVSVLKGGEMLLTEGVREIDKINLIKMAYTQITADTITEEMNQEFYQLLKYNEAILRSLPVNLIVTDTQCRIKMVNDYCKTYFNLERESYRNIPLNDILYSTHPDVADLICGRNTPDAEINFRLVHIQCNAVSTTSNVKLFPIFDGQFRIGNIFIIEDMSEFSRLQNQVVLSEKLASVGLLAAGVAHEINNPLEIISNSLTYLKNHISTNELREAINDIDEEMSSIGSIVSNLHSFTNKNPLVTEEFDINPVINSILQLIRHSARRKNIKIHFTPAPQDLFICGNHNEMKQVLLNLFKNSFEAMNDGGSIGIETELDHEASRIRIRFHDTGHGIQDDNPDNVFLPFYSTKQGQQSNMGLGLSVSYGIIKKHNGNITAENLPESGCLFTIDLPASQYRQ
ncbi:MAG: ATP-binding cassette domain-containing protein [Spartobacteria bacterium]|nr:ATP-binding cassette domain-containing protein [Spartobacteria bacterium]